MIYAARFETMNALLNYLTENCCQGPPSAPAKRRSSKARQKERAT